MAFDGLMTSSVAASLKESLLAGRINKIYQLSNHEILMQIRAQGKNQKVLFSTHSSYARVQITKLDYQYPDEPPMFCMFLRKHLEGGIIYNIGQINHDRIIKFYKMIHEFRKSSFNDDRKGLIRDDNILFLQRFCHFVDTSNPFY